MIIESVHIKNFRSILDEKINCEELTALVGANGTGKSSFLRAIDLFYSTSLKIDIEDFYNNDISKEIVVQITYKDLSTDAKELFSIYLQGDKLTVERVFTYDDGKIVSKYHGATLQNPEFINIRESFIIKDRGKTAKGFYEKIRKKEEYNSLSISSKKEEVLENLKQWEANHPEKCIRQRDDGQLFGFKEVGQGYLGRFTRFIFIPAVRDVSDDIKEGRGSVITELMDLVVRSVLSNKEEVIKLKDDTREQYRKIMDPKNLTELNDLSDIMTKTLKTFVPDARVDLQWKDFSDIDIPMPQADVRLIEDGYSSTVMRTGHGLQRAFILTILQHLALAQKSAKSPLDNGNSQISKFPNLVLAIEEPELYQHPNRQRHLEKIFYQLSSGQTPGVAEKTQIIYGTHSPLFIRIDHIEQIILLRKIKNENNPKITKVIHTDLGEVATQLGNNYTAETLLPRLKAIMTPWMNEGFFADVAVLVEGEDDLAAILGIARAMGHEFEGYGISVIPCGGKTNIDRPYVIFSQLGIPVYIIWDGDYGKGETEGVCERCERPLDKKPNPLENRRLLSLVGYDEEDWPEYIEENFACFKYDLETTIKNEIGKEFFEEQLDKCRSKFCISKRKHAIKNPNVIKEIINTAKEQGKNIDSLNRIIDKILELKQN